MPQDSLNSDRVMSRTHPVFGAHPLEDEPPVIDPEILASELFSLVDVVFPGQSNHHGTLFGGAALAMMDKFAFVLASRRLRRTVVTAALNQTKFRAPVPAGHIAEVSGRIVRQGRRSVDIEAELIAEDMLTGQRRSCLSGRFAMVAMAGNDRDAVATAAVSELALATSDTVRVVEIFFPGQVNHRGIVHGGSALDWLGKAALVAATRRARQAVVMASSETLDFVAPARVGDIVETVARVVTTGRSSLTVEATMTAETPQAGERPPEPLSSSLPSTIKAGRSPFLSNHIPPEELLIDRSHHWSADYLAARIGNQRIPAPRP